MKKLPLVVRILLVVVVIIGGIILGQTALGVLNNITASSPEWTVFNSDIGQFKALMPGTPTDKVLEQDAGNGTTTTVHRMILLEPVTGESFVITYMELTPDQMAVYGSSEAVLSDVKTSMSASFTIESSANVIIKGGIAEKLLITSADKSVKSQVVTYVINRRLYSLTFSQASKNFSQADADKFTDSFVLAS